MVLGSTTHGLNFLTSLILQSPSSWVSAHPFLDANEITPLLWQGSVPPRGDRLNQVGIKVLVLCAREWQFREKPEPFLGVRIIRAPNDDSPKYPLTREKLRIALWAAGEVSRAIQAGEQVLVTCAAGLNRSGLVSALTLHKLYGWSGERCIRQVQEKRRNSAAHPGLGALSNPEFVTALRRLPGGAPAESLPPGWGRSKSGLILPL